VNITVKLSGQLLPDTPRSLELTLEHQTTVQDLIALLGLEADEVGLIVINGVQSELEDLVSTDCRIAFFPHLSGG
jgi:molybdopterin converting factor small subunit